METGHLSPDLLEITVNEINFDLELDIMNEIAGKVMSKVTRECMGLTCLAILWEESRGCLDTDKI